MGGNDLHIVCGSLLVESIFEGINMKVSSTNRRSLMKRLVSAGAMCVVAVTMMAGMPGCNYNGKCSACSADKVCAKCEAKAKACPDCTADKKCAKCEAKK